MKKLAIIILSLLSFSCFANTKLTALDKKQIEQNIVAKTLVSIPVGNLNDKTIQDVFYIYIEKDGKIWGKMRTKIQEQPQSDQGTYSISRDGTISYTWQHWNNTQRLCGRLFGTKNAYIFVDCDNVFHTAYLKENVLSGNQAK